LPIGEPLDNTKVYILDRCEKLVPVGVAGELCIGGDGVARGYLNNVELTADRFKINPFSEGELFYQSGDLCRWLFNGNIEFLGRIDHQVKIRGYRIELGEIESQLLYHPEVQEAVVLARGNEEGEKYLCAYLIAGSREQGAGGGELREYLSRTLPDYMIPSYFVFLETLPLTPNGKLDRRALPAPALISGSEYVAPGDEIEKKLAVIWAEVLGSGRDASHATRIGIGDNFFDLGGHSLKATIMTAKIHKSFNVRIPLTEIFKTPTIRNLSEYIKKAQKEEFDVTDDALILLKRKSKEANHLFFIHDGSGEVEGYLEFCQHLDESLDFNCWGLKADPLENYAPQNLTIEEIAGKYIRKIRSLQPQDPYFIVGWSIGGTIAFEIARQLEELRQEVAFLGLIDSHPPQKKLKKWVTQFDVQSELKWIITLIPDESIKLQAHHISENQRFWRFIVEYVKKSRIDIHRIKKNLPHHVVNLIPNFDEIELKELLRRVNLIRTLDNARNAYIPTEKIRTTIHFFAATESQFRKNTWNHYCQKSTKFYKVIGDHFSIFKSPGVAEFAKIFDRAVINNTRLKIRK
jgi:thioesterase domain-containing protein/acyl carrier protein